MSELVLKQLNATQLAKMLNISKATLSKKLNSKSEFSLDEIQQIGNIIGKEKVLDIFLQSKFPKRNKGDYLWKIT